MNRYKVKLTKKYIFDLDGKNEENIREQVDYIMTQSKILDLPCVIKKIDVKVKRIKSRKK